MITTKNYSYGLKPSKKRVSAQTVVSNVILYALMTALAIVLLVPYLYMINRSLMTADNAKYSYDFFTKDWMFSNFKTLFYDNTVEGNSANPLAYLSGLKWTVIIIAFNLVAVPLSSSLIAYSFAKLKWTGRNVMFFLMLGTMMLPAAVTQLPLYVMYSQNGIFGNGGFNWLDTIYPFTIPNLFGGGAVYIFLTRQFMLGIPKDFDEAAKIDGAGHLRVLFSVVLPLAKPGIATLTMFYGVTRWNEYFRSGIYISSIKKVPLQVILRKFIVDSDVTTIIGTQNLLNYNDLAKIDYTALQYATIVIAVVPILLIYPLVLKYYTKGIMAGGVKE